MKHLLPLGLAALLGLPLPPALAQPGPPTSRARAKAAAEVPTVALRGTVVGPDGPLPGAIITLKQSNHTAVTNSNGVFLLTMPAGPAQPAIVSFAGYEDEEVTIDPNTQDATVRLLTAHPIKVSRKQSLKTYMKTARKQSRRESRKLR